MSATTPDEAVRRLEEGNARFTAGKLIHPHLDAARLADTAANGQHPFATVLACSDSRCPVELLFDQGVGDLFVVRAAGNVCGPDQVGSVQYAVEHLQTKLMVVLGHTQCGAVAAAAQAELYGHLAKLVDRIKPAVASTKKTYPDLSGNDFISQAAKANVWQVVGDLMRETALMHGRFRAAEPAVVGALYDVATGYVEWLTPPPEYERPLA